MSTAKRALSGTLAACWLLAAAGAAPVPPAGVTQVVSVNAAGTAGAGGDDTYTEAITPNGRYVVFGSDADDLVAGDANGTYDLFLRDLKTKTTRLISQNATGTGSG